MPSWEDMAEQVLVQGRPGDVRSVADGWKQAIDAFNDVHTSLTTNIKELNHAWKGAGYEAFKTHITGIADSIEQLAKDAQVDHGIVQALNTAASDLEDAQRAMPIPKACIGDLLAARNGVNTISPGFFTITLHASIFQSGPVHWEASAIDTVDDWIHDRTGEAEGIYNTLNKNTKAEAGHTPGQATDPHTQDQNATTPDLGNGGGGGGGGKVPKLGGGGMPPGGSGPLPDPTKGIGDPPGTGDLPTTGSTGLPDSSFPGSGDGFDSGTVNPPDPSSLGGLAGAGGGFGGAGGLPSGLSGAGAGLGAGGLGAGGLGGGLPGGGALGKATMPNLASMMGAGGMGGLGAGAGRGGSAAGKSGRSATSGGGHGGHGGNEDERLTWLQEDDDPWGSDGGAPGVLR